MKLSNIWSILPRSNPPLKNEGCRRVGEVFSPLKWSTCLFYLIISTRNLRLKKQRKPFRNLIFIGFTRVMRMDTISGKSLAFVNGGLLLGNIDHIYVLQHNILNNFHLYIILIRYIIQDQKGKFHSIC